MDEPEFTTKSELRKEIDRLESLKKFVDRAYGAFEYLHKVRRDVQEVITIIDEVAPLTEESPEWLALKELIYSDKEGDTDNIIRPASAIFGSYSVPAGLRNLPLDERLRYISTDSVIAREFVDDLAQSISEWGRDLCGGMDPLKPDDAETRNYLIGISQFVSRKISHYKRQLNTFVEVEVQDKRTEEAKEQWRKSEHLIELVNTMSLPLDKEMADKIHEIFCTGKLRGATYDKTTQNLRERADSQIVYRAIEILRNSDPEKALALADEVRNNELREDIYLQDINCPKSLVRLIIAPDTNLAKRISQYEPPSELDFDAPLVVLVGRNGSGKSSIMKSIAEYPDIESKSWADSHKGIALSFTNLIGGYFDRQRQQLTEQEFLSGKSDSNKDTIVFRPDIKGRFLPSYVDMTGMYTSRVVERSANIMSAGQAQLNLIENGVDDIGITGVYTGLQYIQPSVLLLDEIGNQVDPINAKRIASKLNELTERRQIVIASHNPNVVINLRPDAILYSMNEVEEGKPIGFRKGDLNSGAVEYLMFGEELP